MNLCNLINVYELYSRNPGTVKYGTNRIFSVKNMVYSTSDHKRKHFHIFLQNKNKKMETTFPMPALQDIFVTCWFYLKVNFISLVSRPGEEVYSEHTQTSRMELSAYIYNSVRSWIVIKKLHLGCLSGFWIRLWYF